MQEAVAATETVHGTTPMLRCQGLRKHYGERLAVDGVSFAIGEAGVLRPARSERRRQDDDHLHALRADRAATRATS